LLVVLAATVVLFFIHDRIGLESGVVALIGACGGLLWLWPDVKRALGEVHWDVLLFFVGLFVIVGGLEASGALDVVAHAIASMSEHGVIFAALAVLWVSAFMSAVVDNIPFTIAMLPILGGLAAHGIDAGPLWWALALGVGFGGNATPVGATANVIAMSYSSNTPNPITTWMWIRRGLPVTFVACAAASGLVILAISVGWF
jgi:Na+/H+ antiporter NhaD/arsenite permease-like protein